MTEAERWEDSGYTDYSAAEDGLDSSARAPQNDIDGGAAVGDPDSSAAPQNDIDGGDGTVKTKQCVVCGAPLGRWQRKFCRVCAEEEKLKRNRRSYQRVRAQREEYRLAHPKCCAKCGQPIEEDRLKKPGVKYCKTCSWRMYGYRYEKKPEPPEQPQKLETAKARLRRKLQLSGAQIDRLAREYGPPYDSYGKLRAYIEAYDRLPPASCRKDMHPNVEDPYAWKKLAAGKPQPRRRGTRWQEMTVEISIITEE